MRYLLIALILTLNALAYTPEQIANLRKCYDYGKPYGLAETLAAICLHESMGGMVKINAESKDYGIAQNNIKTALKRLNLKPTWYNKKRLATILVENDDLSLSLAVDELRYWRDTRKRKKWKDYVESYNQGNSWEEYRYSAAISKAHKELKKARFF